MVQILVPDLKFSWWFFFFPYTTHRHGDKVEVPRRVSYLSLFVYLHFVPWKHIPARRGVTWKSALCRHATVLFRSFQSCLFPWWWVLGHVEAFSCPGVKLQGGCIDCPVNGFLVSLRLSQSSSSIKENLVDSMKMECVPAYGTSWSLRSLPA